MKSDMHLLTVSIAKTRHQTIKKEVRNTLHNLITFEKTPARRTTTASLLNQIEKLIS